MSLNEQVQELRRQVEHLDEAVGVLAKCVARLFDVHPDEKEMYSGEIFELLMLVPDEVPEDLVAQEDEDGTEEDGLQAIPAYLQNIPPQKIEAIVVIPEEALPPEQTCLTGLSNSPEEKCPCVDCWKYEQCQDINPDECR